jgi:hypothetical protein
VCLRLRGWLGEMGGPMVERVIVLRRRERARRPQGSYLMGRPRVHLTGAARGVSNDGFEGQIRPFTFGIKKLFQSFCGAGRGGRKRLGGLFTFTWRGQPSGERRLLT